MYYAWDRQGHRPLSPQCWRSSFVVVRTSLPADLTDKECRPRKIDRMPHSLPRRRSTAISRGFAKHLFAYRIHRESFTTPIITSSQASQLTSDTLLIAARKYEKRPQVLGERTHSSFHSETLSTSFSRPRSCLVNPSALYSRFSTTDWVDIPA